MPCRTATSSTTASPRTPRPTRTAGINAADAFTIAQVAIGLLRQQLPSSVRVHGMMTSGGEAPNAIAERTEGRWYVRAETLAELAEVEPRVMRCFEAGALATGCELDRRPRSPSRTRSFAPTTSFSRCYERRATSSSAGASAQGPDTLMDRASTDMGNVSQSLPAIHPYIGIDSLPAVNHQPEFAAATISSCRRPDAVDGASALALTLLDAASDARRADDFSMPEIELTMMSVDTRSSTTCSATATCPRTSTTACTPRARCRTSRSRACRSRGHSDLIVALAWVKLAAAEANQRLGLLDSERRRRHRRGVPRDQVPASCTTSSSSTRSRAGPARRPT